MANVMMFFDLETGDLHPESGDILTGYFGMFDEDFKLLDELSLKLKPDGRLPMAEAGALKVNKIDIKQHLVDPETVPYSVGKERLVALIQKHLSKNGRYSNIIPGGFNINFDIKFIHHYLISPKQWENLVHYKPRDVMNDVECLKYHGWLPKDVGKLTQAADYFGVAQGTAHTARDDIFMTIAVQKKISELMDSKKSGGQAKDLISLLEAE